jgi:GntR family transcriptional repressor for pyruvate dehydrogenase complex
MSDKDMVTPTHHSKDRYVPDDLPQTRSSKAAANEDLLRRLQPLESGRGVLDALVEMIEAADLQVGDRLPPEIELARRLNVGRSTIREALKAWQGMGIVVRNKGAGTTLAAEISTTSIRIPMTLKVEAESLLRTHAVRRPLEIEAVRIATTLATDQQRKVIIARMAELIAVYEAGEDWRPADARFHSAIYEASGNPLFQQLISQIHSAFHDIYRTPFGKPHLGEDTIPLHRPLAEAIAAKDVEAATRFAAEVSEMVEIEVLEVMKGQKIDR